MVDVTEFSLPGSLTSSGTDTLANFLRVYQGMVLKAMKDELVVAPHVTRRSITSGKSAQFPLMGRVFGAYHVRGQDILNGSDHMKGVEFGEKLIHVDQPYKAPAFIADIDEVMSHYPLAGPIAEEAGRTLARQIEQTVIISGFQGALSAALMNDPDSLGGIYAGSTIYDNTAGGVDRSAEAMVSALQVAQIVADEKRWPSGMRFCVLTPRAYSLLLRDTSGAPTVASGDYGSSASAQRGVFPELFGFKLMKSNLLPSGSVSHSNAFSGTTGNDYTHDFTNYLPTGLCWAPWGIGHLNVRGVRLEHERKATHGGDFLVNTVIAGSNFLNPAGCIGISGAVTDQSGSGDAYETSAILP